VDVRGRLHLDEDPVGPRLGERHDLALGALDHEVDVEDRARTVHPLAQRLDDDRPHRDRRDEVAVHHVHVDRLRPGVQHGLHLLAQAREVRGEDRGSDAGAGHQIGSSMESPQAWQVVVAVEDMRTIVECSPQFGQTDRSS